MIINLAKKTRLKTANKVCKEDITINPMLQTKKVTENGIIVPDAGYVGLGKVDVNVSNSIFDNIDNPMFPKFGNIKFFEGEGEDARHIPMMLFPTSYTKEASFDSGARASFGTILGTLFKEGVTRGTYTPGERIAVIGAVWVNIGTPMPITLSSKRFPACKLRAMIENVYSGVREIREKEVEEVLINSLSIPGESIEDAGVFQMYSVSAPIYAEGERLIAAELIYPSVE